MAYLVITEAGKEPYRHELKGATTLGRAPDCSICLRDTLLSRQHCRIEPLDSKGSAWAIVDLESRNGTRVGKTRIARHALADGAAIHIGQTSMLFHAAGFVAKRPEAPTGESSDSAPDVDLDDLLSRVPARETDHLPKPMPRLAEMAASDDAFPSSSRLSPSDTTLDASHAMDGGHARPFARPAPRPQLRESVESGPAHARRRKPAIVAAYTAVALLLAAVLVWWLKR